MLYCKIPFEHTLVFEDRLEGCCGDWCSLQVPLENGNIEKAWNSKEYKEFRDTIVDGSYRYCNSKCPYLGDIKHGRESALFVGSVNELSSHLKHIKFCSDYTCNLHCNTCRESVKSGQYARGIIVSQLDSLNDSSIATTVERIDLLGTGDPFASPYVRTWLRTLNLSKYPKLKNVHLHTNGQLWTEKVWNSFSPEVQNLISSTEISIDAASKDVYESIRRGGSWDRLINNLKFIVKLDNLKDIQFSFTIQKLNSKEIIPFYRLIEKLKEQSEREYWWAIRYSPAEKWPTISQEHFDVLSIKNYPEDFEQAKKDIAYLSVLGKGRIHSAL